MSVQRGIPRFYSVCIVLRSPERRFRKGRPTVEVSEFGMVVMAQLLTECAPQVSPVLMEALVQAESGWRPLAIGMDASQGRVRHPSSLTDAIATAKALSAGGRKFSVGLAQIHVSNVRLYGMSWEQAFDACKNLAVGQRLLWKFYDRAVASGYSGVGAVWAALRGYNSGSIDREASDAYANRIFASMRSAPAPAPTSRTSPLSLAVAMPGVQASKIQPTGEALDIFEKSKPVGF